MSDGGDETTPPFEPVKNSSKRLKMKSAKDSVSSKSHTVVAGLNASLNGEAGVVENSGSPSTSTHSRTSGVKPGPSKKSRRASSMKEGMADTNKSENVQGTIEPDMDGGLMDYVDGEAIMEPQVSQLLNQLSSQIHHRVRAKKQRLDQNFQAVYSIPARILGLQNEQRSSREQMITEFKDAIGSINDKLNDIIQHQHKNEEKQGKMLIALSRENEEMKKLVTECNDLQRTAFEKFFLADKNLTKQVESEAVKDAEMQNKCILIVEKKLLADGQKEGSDALFNLHRFI